ncbi:MAG: methionine--tRNA ligase [Candidatus Omnitrophota bacterium]
MKKFYITTPIYYVNANPHIGHSYTNIAADSLARYMRRAIGDNNVYFLTGSDEHGQKIQKAADEAGLSPQEFVDRVVVQFKDLWKRLDISYDGFIRTTEERHITFVQKTLKILYERGQIYESQYEGWYCTPCETFWTELQITDKICPDCKRPLEKISETNYFFKLSDYQGWLIEHIENTPHFIEPQIRRNEVLSFLRSNKLTDLCVSRPIERLSWGIPLPFAKNHVAYVWFDALINYISAVGEFDAEDNYKSKWWQPDVKVTHLIGKDILRHHAIYWPIMLKALMDAGICGIRLPDTIFAHGWWLISDAKMSKSLGNVVSPLDMIDRFGLDAYRYFLLSETPFGYDGNFSEPAIIKRFNGDLANDLGNLLYRALTMIEKYFQGTIPDEGILEKQELDEGGRRIYENIKAMSAEVDELLSAGSGFNFSLVFERIWVPVHMANKYIEDKKPWNLAKEGKTEELKVFIRLLVEAIRKVGDSISPFIPKTAESIKEQIGKEKINKGKPLFPRIEQR